MNRSFVRVIVLMIQNSREELISGASFGMNSLLSINRWANKQRGGACNGYGGGGKTSILE